MKNYIYIDSDYEEFELEYALEEVNALFSRVFPKGTVAMIGKNHGWRKLDGYRTPEFFSRGVSALAKAVVDGASCKIRAARNSEYGYHIAINSAHHDSPTWDEWTYLVRPSRFPN